jgi:hypothetical protein
MSFETITVARQAPIINGYVQLENNNLWHKSTVPVDSFVALTGGVVNRLPHVGGMGRDGRRFGPQEWVELLEVYQCCEWNSILQGGEVAFHTNERTDIAIPWNRK